MGADATLFRERASRPALPKHSKTDLGDMTKWSMGDLDIFGKTVKSLESDILALYELQNTMKPLMREVESNLLKGVIPLKSPIKQCLTSFLLSRDSEGRDSQVFKGKGGPRVREDA